MSTISTPDANGFYYYSTRDQYGRPNKNFQRGCGDIRAILVTLPKSYAAEYGHRYLVNNWTLPTFVTGPEGTPIQNPDKVQYFTTIGEAKKYITDNIDTSIPHPMH